MVTIRQLREREALTQRDLAERAEISRATVVKIEQGNGPMPTPTVRRKLASVFGVHPSQINWPGIDDESEDLSQTTGYLKVAEPHADWKLDGDASSKRPADGA